jgi:large subunit ribosomal protein L3
MKFILAKKLEMSQRFRQDGTVVPVTLLAAGPCVVTQVRTKEKDGYDAVQLGFGEDAHPNRPMKGHAKAVGKAFKTLKEFRLGAASELKVGDAVQAASFEPGDVVEVQGVSKGKGFQGVVKRHHFRGGPATHGQKDQLRMPGSIGGGGRHGRGRVVKGMRMAGHMGMDTVTVKNLEVVEVDAGAGVIAVKGAVPGARGALLAVASLGKEHVSWK